GASSLDVPPQIGQSMRTLARRTHAARDDNGQKQEGKPAPAAARRGRRTRHVGGIPQRANRGISLRSELKTRGGLRKRGPWIVGRMRPGDIAPPCSKGGSCDGAGGARRTDISPASKCWVLDRSNELHVITASGRAFLSWRARIAVARSRT